MARIKRSKLSRVRKTRLYARAKGFFLGRKRLRQAMEHVDRAKRSAFAGRKQKKRHFRGIWIVRINAALSPLGLSYSRFIHLLKVANVGLDRKILADLALHDPAAFTAVVEHARAAK